MFTVNNIVEKLNFFDVDCDIYQVESLIKKLRLEPIFENDSGELYYDDESYEAIKSYLEVKKSQSETKIAELVDEITTLNKEEKPEQTALTVDKTGKSIEVIAKTLSQQITNDLTDFIKKNLSVEEAFKAGVFKRDNEILSKKLQDTINDNKKLIEKIRQLEYEIHKFHPVFGNIYVKSK
ncbi:hypothetical protein IJE86_06425 [bacterium]|nr:hypothetical protein [bacterium]